MLQGHVSHAQVESEQCHYSRLIQLIISLECFIEIAPDFLCPFRPDQFNFLCHGFFFSVE